MTIESRWLGTRDYEEALAEQLRCFEQVRAGHDGFFLGVEHPTVITLGRRSDASADLVGGFRNIPVIATDRGGQATLHSAGQLLVYPILPLRRWALGPRAYVETLLETTARLLRTSGLAAEARFENAGVYTAKGKIAFCGVRVEQGISRHGLSLNVRNDLSLFRFIRPCGMTAPALTSWAHERAETLPPLEVLFGDWVRAWEQGRVAEVPRCSPESGTVSDRSGRRA